MSDSLAIALPKGRILDEALPLLLAAGIEPAEDITATRKLLVNTTDKSVQLLVVRSSDVPAYVQHGGADVGITGKDTLLEHEDGGIYEPLDLRIGGCKMVLAGKPGVDAKAKSQLRVATKFPLVTRNFFAQRGQQVEIIKLYGSMELAPLVGMADLIVDIMDTGDTLRANGLEVFETIGDISARLVVNKASMKMKHERLHALIADIKAELKKKRSAIQTR